jgi:hydrogenase maturation protease
MLAGRTLPEDVEVVDGGTQGLGIVPLMQGRRRVIFCDAADMGQEPGHLARFTPDEVRLLSREQGISIHEAGLRDALVLAEALDALPQEIVIFGVQPANVDWDSALSPQVEAALPELAEAILKEIGGGG